MKKQLKRKASSEIENKAKAKAKDKAKAKAKAKDKAEAVVKEEYIQYIPACLPKPSLNDTYYAVDQPLIIDLELGLRYPDMRETLSLDDGLDQTPILKKISGHYCEYQPSSTIVDIVSALSPVDLYKHDVNKHSSRDAYSKLAPAVVSVSSFFAVERKIDCSGLVIDWDCHSGEATILTSAKLLWNTGISDAEFHLIVRMADGRLLLAKEDYVDYYHKLLTLKVKSTIQMNVVDLSAWQAKEADIVDGMNVMAVGRCFFTCSLSDHSGELYKEYPFFGCDELWRSTCCISESCEGGPLVTNTGSVVGVNFFDDYTCGHPLPTPVILNCLKMWSSFRTVLRPFFGMSVVDVDQLPYRTRESLNISLEESFVVVKEVFKGSLADKNDIRSGDLIATLNAVPIQSAKQYLKLMFDKSLEVTAASGCVEQSFKVVVKASDRRCDDISIEANFLSVDDKSFYDCWPRLDAEKWSRQKLGSQKNPLFCWPPDLEIC